MGIWFAGTVFSAVVAAQNFYTIDRLIEQSTSEPFRQAMDRLGSESGRDFLRYLSSELNRLYFQWWNIAQLGVLVLTLWLIRPFPWTKRAVWCLVGILAVVIFLTVVVTPQVVSIGRVLDFVPREPPPPQLRTFGLLHAAFSVFTLINLILGVLVVFGIQKRDEG
jgi:hypothetical protein